MIFCSCGRFILAFICDMALETPFIALAIADCDRIVYRERENNRYYGECPFMYMFALRKWYNNVT